MAVNIHNLISAISPDTYCEPSVKGEVKKMVKEALKEGNKRAYLKASEKTKLRESSYMDIDEIGYKNPFSLPGIKNPIEQHTLVYDSFGEGLEPIYFWIIDKAVTSEYKRVTKLVDNFVSSPGSAHFSEMGQKATKMQEEGMKILGTANQIVRSVLNIVYDLKEFKLRLSTYDQYYKGNSAEKQAALLSLKQIWMDSVDIKRGTTSLKGLIQQFDYVTIIDAFMSADTLERLKSIDLNDRVKRIVEQRLNECLKWISESDQELRKRFEIEKKYLRSQVAALQLYARWAKPYLNAAKKLEMNASPTAALVTTFNTSLFELVLLAETDYKPEEDIQKGDLPEMINKVSKRKYNPLVVIELKFRSAPERTQQGGYGFRGRVDITFTSYALNEDEIKVLKEEVERDDMGDVLSLVEGATTESLQAIQADIDSFLNEDKLKEEAEMKKRKDTDENDTNPFSALFSGLFDVFKSEKKKSEKKDLSKGIEPDSDIEKVIRSQAILEARKKCQKFYGLYKKEHGMPAI